MQFGLTTRTKDNFSNLKEGECIIRGICVFGWGEGGQEVENLPLLVSYNIILCLLLSLEKFPNKVNQLPVI